MRPNLKSKLLNRYPEPYRERSQLRCPVLVKHIGQRVVSPDTHTTVANPERVINFKRNHPITPVLFQFTSVSLLARVNDFCLGVQADSPDEPSGDIKPFPMWSWDLFFQHQRYR